MKNVFLMILAPLLLLIVTLGFGQALSPPGNTDQASIKGCLAGSDGNYTVSEFGTTRTYKVTSSTVDLKPHVGHDIEVTGQKMNATSSDSTGNSVAVTGMNMISEHCATATATATPATAGALTVADTIPAGTTDTSVVADTAPATTAGTPPPADITPAPTANTPVAADPRPTTTAREPDDTNPNTKPMPNTATPLPLLGLLGLGLLGLGLLTTSRLRKRSRTN